MPLFHGNATYSQLAYHWFRSILGIDFHALYSCFFSYIYLSLSDIFKSFMSLRSTNKIKIQPQFTWHFYEPTL